MALEQKKLRDFVSQTLSTLELVKPTFASPTQPLESVVAAMRERGDSCALIVQEDELRGIITERDVLCRFMDGAVQWDQPVQAVMTPDPASLTPTDRIADAIRLMRERDFRTVPIVDGGTVRGLVRLGDLLRHLAELFPEEILNLPPRPQQQMPSPEGA